MLQKENLKVMLHAIIGYKIYSVTSMATDKVGKKLIANKRYRLTILSVVLNIYVLYLSNFASILV